MKSFANMKGKVEKIWTKYDGSIKLSDKKQKVVIKECLAELNALLEDERNADSYYLKGHIHYIYEIPDSYNGKEFFKKLLK